ncbi:hypothetical protein AVEN_2698-1 [Araneus ventricosus]|uniref:Endonuclease/exonuclease/phosphatase domain-containing protein n=1 Tax=Araneus ventricosus TaxID=182803 RepID=A0A4Y2JXP7_ARAVE|nr:hypothetical protein AVEN_2698-1 [Araneus ventricosus]
MAHRRLLSLSGKNPRRSCVFNCLVVFFCSRQLGPLTSLAKFGCTSNLYRNTSKGWVDLSLCTQQMIGETANWEILEEPSLSDHQYIEITIDSFVKKCAFTRYKTLHGNHNIFLRILKPYVNSVL